eukprot:scaffold4412_cov91-Cylindrotheca_fusiformis.AAC.9
MTIPESASVSKDERRSTVTNEPPIEQVMEDRVTPQEEEEEDDLSGKDVDSATTEAESAVPLSSEDVVGKTRDVGTMTTSKTMKKADGGQQTDTQRTTTSISTPYCPKAHDINACCQRQDGENLKVGEEKESMMKRLDCCCYGCQRRRSHGST